MKKLLALVFLSCFVATASFAQQFGIRAGMNVSNVSADLDDMDIPTDSRAGIQLGVMGGVPLSGNLHLNGALLFNQKGFSVDLLGVEARNSFNYLEVPLNLQYKAELAAVKLFVEGGPYFAYALGGTSKIGDEEEKIEWGSSGGELKRIDSGVGIGAGIEISKFRVGVNYNLGISDLSNDDEEELKNGVFGINVAYFFLN